jgi:hypothetical protein
MKATTETARALWIRHFLFLSGALNQFKKKSFTQIQNICFIFTLNLDDRNIIKLKNAVLQFPHRYTGHVFRREFWAYVRSLARNSRAVVAIVEREDHAL